MLFQNMINQWVSSRKSHEKNRIKPSKQSIHYAIPHVLLPFPRFLSGEGDPRRAAPGALEALRAQETWDAQRTPRGLKDREILGKIIGKP